MQYIVCIVPVAPLRAMPHHRCEMNSQFLFGEVAMIMEEKTEGWAYVKCTWDGYLGWARLNQFEIRDEAPVAKWFAGNWINEITWKGYKLKVPYGSNLLENEQASNAESIIPIQKNISVTTAQIKSIAFTFLHTAYCWGGRSVFGIDCSGFVQVVYKMLGVSLLRDAHLQAGQGKSINNLQEACCGDLAFFEEPAGIISHVGMLLNSSEIIHASGEVRIDKIDSKGIINSSTGLRTHQLCMQKRIL